MSLGYRVRTWLRAAERRPILATALFVVLTAAALTCFSRFGALRPMVTASGRRLTGLCAATSRAHCEKRIACGVLEPSSLDACIEDTGLVCERGAGWKLRARVVSLGREAGQECIEGLERAGCNALQFNLGEDELEPFELTTQCELQEMLEARSGLGEPCADSSDCKVGFCPGLSTSCHACTPYVAEGGACEAGVRECEPGLRCKPDANGLATCARPAATGSPCASRDECAPGGCVRVSGGDARTCAPAPAGARCLDVDDCQAGLFCNAGGACEKPAATGAVCKAAVGACAEPEASCVAGRCLVRPFALGAGEPCRSFTDCRDGLYCQGIGSGAESGTCAVQAGAGGPCARLDFGACISGAACLEGTCQLLKKENEPCTGPYQCKELLSCVPGQTGNFESGARCLREPRLGEPCQAKYQRCVASLCDEAKARCVPLIEGNGRCERSEQCESGWCVPRPGGGTCYAPCARD